MGMIFINKILSISSNQEIAKHCLAGIDENPSVERNQVKTNQEWRALKIVPTLIWRPIQQDTEIRGWKIGRQPKAGKS